MLKKGGNAADGNQVSFLVCRKLGLNLAFPAQGMIAMALCVGTIAAYHSGIVCA